LAVTAHIGEIRRIYCT